MTEKKTESEFEKLANESSSEDLISEAILAAQVVANKTQDRDMSKLTSLETQRETLNNTIEYFHAIFEYKSRDRNETEQPDTPFDERVISFLRQENKA